MLEASLRHILRVVIRTKVIVLQQLSNAADKLIANSVAALVAFWESLQYKNRGLVRQAMGIVHYAVNTLDLYRVARAE